MFAAGAARELHLQRVENTITLQDQIDLAAADQSVFLFHAVENLRATCRKEPPMPVIMGAGCYEGHMQNGFRYVQCHMFWQYMRSGAANVRCGGHLACECAGRSRLREFRVWRQKTARRISVAKV